MLKWMWFSGGLLAGLMILSISKASMYSSGSSSSGNAGSSSHLVHDSIQSVVTDDTALYQKMSEIRIQRAIRKDFDADLVSLAALENQARYHEKLPFYTQIARLRTPMQRVAQQKYKFQGGPVAVPKKGK